MPWKEKEIEKYYYSIGEVAEMLSISSSQIRYWETQFEILNPKKNARGDRFYNKDDVQRIKLIYHLLKEKGFTVEGAKERLKHDFTDEQRKQLVTEKLRKVQSFLQELKDEL
jgi:DNA-binding transcriptional MerR regulator